VVGSIAASGGRRFDSCRLSRDDFMERCVSGDTNTLEMYSVRLKPGRRFDSVSFLIFQGIMKWYHPTFGASKRQFDSAYPDQQILLLRSRRFLHKQTAICGFEPHPVHSGRVAKLVKAAVKNQSFCDFNLSIIGAIVYRLGHDPFTVGSGVRFPVALPYLHLLMA
jgi:hypothetical protein